MGIIEIPEAKVYPSGQPFVKYSADGGSFAFYPSGRMAAAYERMGAGFYFYAYADNAAGTTLMAMDPYGEGFCAFPNGKPRLTSRKTGGTFVGDDGMITRLWTTLKPLNPESPIAFDLSPHIHIKFGSRQLVSAKLSCQGLSQDYQLGEVPKAAQDSYLSKAVRQIKDGPERGKYILDVDKCRAAAEENRARREAMAMKELDVAKTHITEEDMQKHPQLRPIVTSTSDLQASINRGEWSVDVFNSKQKLADTLSASFPTLTMGDSLKSDPAIKTLDSLAATKPDLLAKLLQQHEGQNMGALPLSNAIMSASGRYRPEHGTHYKTPRRRLRELKAKTFEESIKEAEPTTLVVVCCGAGWLPQWRRMEPVLETVNGELAAAAAAAAAAASGNAPISGGGGAASGGQALPPFVLRKFDMSESRYIRDKYNVNTLPMFLMYYGGRLVYASTTLNGYGTARDDLIAQVRASLAAAQRGSFLPDNFRFGTTDNNTTDQFASTLAATAPILGKS